MPSDVPRAVIYVVEGDAAVREALSRVVRAAGFEARPRETIDALVTQFEPATIGCILLDITDLSQREIGLAAELHDRGIDLPLIGLSASHGAAARRWARVIGSRFLFGKPVDDQALLDAIEWVIETKAQPAAEPAGVAAAPQPPTNHRHARNRRKP